MRPQQVWERAYNATSLSPDEDPDGDGMTNQQEAQAGTDPFDSASNLNVSKTIVPSTGLLLAWAGVEGRAYQVETSSGTTTALSWTSDIARIEGVNGPIAAFVQTEPQESQIFRIRVASEVDGPRLPSTWDRDGDGQSDADELMAGTDWFDPHSRFEISSIRRSHGLLVEWQAQPGKVYQLQSKGPGAADEWQPEGPALKSSDTRLSASLPEAAANLSLRVLVSDIDSDGDGVSDWEERLTGLDPHRRFTRQGSVPDHEALQLMLDEPVTYAVTATRPVALAGISGVIEIRRKTGFGPLAVPLTIGGSAIANEDVATLPAEVRFPPGSDRVAIEVVALPDFRPSHVEVLVSGGEPASIQFVRPESLLVTDFGATGDGITDDTEAIQAAIDYLESTPSANTLHFPAGTYRMSLRTPDFQTNTGRWRLLKLGNLDLAGRDLFFTGEPGTVLFSDTGSLRTHMLVVGASFRSLTFRGLTFEQSSTPLSEVLFGAQPNGADGISVIPLGLREVAAVEIDGCVFRNCHGALTVYNNGYDARGKLRQLTIRDCQILNPYGSNTLNSRGAWGGGQQVILSPWVGTARYENNLFEGGGEDMTDESTSPGGRLKDGSHFGSPLRLEFINNVVRRMGVEAVFQTNDVTFMGSTIDPFVMPEAGGVELAEVSMDALPSTFLPGDVINIRMGATPNSNGNSDLLTVVSYDPLLQRLVLRNDGYPGNSPAGTVIESNRPVYLNRNPEPSVAEIRGNWIDGTLPPGADPSTEPAGIVINALGHITGNTITNQKIGILIYPEVRTLLYPASRWTVMERNTIVARDPRDWPESLTYGIQSWANEEVVANNTLITPASFRFVGIATRGNEARISHNTVISHAPADNGYTNPARAVGIGVGNESMLAEIDGNTTAGFDVGVGPVNANQSIPHRVIDHRSIDDILSIDPRGLVED